MDAARENSLRFWTAGTVIAIALWSTAAPSLVYPLYSDAWHLTPAVTTALFAVYPLALIPMLLIFGSISDAVGRRAAILVGLGVIAVGAAVMGIGLDLTWIFVGRALTGIGVGLALSPATAAMVEYSAGRGRRASAATTAMTATGLTLALLVGGALIQWAPAPAHAAFFVLVGAAVVSFGLAWRLPRPEAGVVRPRWRPTRPHIPRRTARTFTSGVLGVAAAFALGAVFLSLGGHIARDLVHSDSAFVDGIVLAVSSVLIGSTALAARALDPRIAMTIGTPLAVAGLALMISAGAAHSLALFLASSVVGGIGYGLLFSGGLALVNASAPAEHRGAVTSTAYVIVYAAQAVVAIGLGMLASTLGLDPALEIAALVVLASGLSAAGLAWLAPPTVTAPTPDLALVDAD